MKNRENKNMLKATASGVIFCLIVYMITGVTGYFMYREKLTNTILDNLRGEILIYKDANLFIFVILIIINISFLISSTMSIPLMFFSLKRNFLNLIIFCKRNFNGKRKVELKEDKENKDMTNSHSNQHQLLIAQTESAISNKEKIILTIILYLSLCVVTITVTQMKEIFNVVGSTAGNAINYIFPNMFLLKLTSTEIFNCKNIISQILYVLGVIVLFMCLSSEIVKITWKGE
jgi:hypothetical protein